MSILLITGQATSGKSSLGAYLEQRNLAITVSGDAHRFVPGKGWAKRSTENYVRSVEETIHTIMTAHPGQLIALETTVEDVSDSEDARKVCERGLVRQVLVLEMDKDRYLLGVMTRSMRRARGAERQNPVCDETPLAVLCLVAKASKSVEKRRRTHAAIPCGGTGDGRTHCTVSSCSLAGALGQGLVRQRNTDPHR